MPEDQPRADLILNRDQVEFLAQLPMIPPLDFFQLREMGVEFFLRRERGPVDPLEHGVPFVPAPVGAAGREQLHGADLGRRGHVRPPAEVHEVALGVDRDGAGLVEPLDHLDLVGFPLRLKQANGLGLGQFAPRHGQPSGDDLARARLDLFEVLQRERPIEGEIVIEAVFKGRADRELRRGEELLHRLGHDVGAAVPIDFPAFRRVETQRLERTVLSERRGEIDRRPIELGRDDRGAELHAEIGQGLADRRAGGNGLRPAVLQPNVNHLLAHHGWHGPSPVTSRRHG